MTVQDESVDEVRTPSRPITVEDIVLCVLAAGTLVIAVVFSGGTNAFRLPKELVFRAEAVVLLALGALWATATNRRWTFRKRPEYLLAAIILAWTLITVATSTNRQLSVDSLITVAAAIVIFIATSLAAQIVSLVAVDVLMAGCCINAVIVILQELKIWTPFPPSSLTATHYGSVALLGNANDVGTYLVAPALAAVVLAVTASRWRRAIYVLIAALLIAGVVASATRTALFALVAGLVVFGIVHSRVAAAATVAILIALGVVILSPSTTIGRGLRDLGAAAVHRDYETLFSERLLPFLTAADMTRDHPLLGVGPGCFKYHFMRYRVALPARHPGGWTRGYPMNWGEVHNDHLQVAAETGLPGYALFLGAIALCAGKRRTIASTAEAAFARALRWPLATLIFVLCLAQFPLELAAPRLMLLTIGALCLTWDRDDVAI